MCDDDILDIDLTNHVQRGSFYFLLFSFPLFNFDFNFFFSLAVEMKSIQSSRHEHDVFPRYDTVSLQTGITPPPPPHNTPS